MINSHAAKGDGLVLYLMFGMCIASVYAQLFSLFDKVSALANIILILSCTYIVIILRKQIREHVILCMQMCKKPHVWIPLLIFGGLILLVTSGVPAHYDTDLYHTQAIRWIEEYGIVKGLGNLHNRLAYNSSFFCLQALYSLRFIAGKSLHSLNGFITLVMIMYSFTHLWVFCKRRIGISDLLKIAFFIYLFLPSTFISFPFYAPGSDTLTLILVLYIAATWAEYMEQGKSNILNYALCCLLSVWAITVKLSAAMLIILAIYPAVILLKKKDRKTILYLIAAGCVIVTPFIIRNVIISGYLLYPYPKLDLFQVDWKMPASMVAYDSIEIMAWGRSMKSPELYHAPFSKWFSVWYSNLNLFYQVLLWINAVIVLLVPVSLIQYLMRLIKHQKAEAEIAVYEGQKIVLILTCTMGLLMWFCTAPLPRYGIVYLLLLPAIFGGSLRKAKSKKKRYKEDLSWIIFAVGTISAAYFCSISLNTYFTRFEGIDLVEPSDYRLYDLKLFEWEEIIVYAPNNGDRTGYHYFPATNYYDRLNFITLRTGELKDGFRFKEEYSNMSINSTGIPTEK
jgi:hypothetical protein